MTTLKKDSVLLFTGGGKGITAQCAIALSKKLPCTYVLMGRSQPMDLPAWLTEDFSEAQIKQRILAEAKQNSEKLSPKEIESRFRKLNGSLEIQSTLDSIRQNNAKAYYIAADVTEPESVRQCLNALVGETGPITGFIHGAGQLADKRIERKTESDFQAVYGTKVDGLKTILGCLNPEKLDLLVLFSSVAGAFGNAGQADYAMANEFLNKFARQFQQQYPQCHTISINWGPWDSGMVTPALKEAFSQMGINLISIEEGTEQFVKEIMEYDHPNPQVVFGSKIERPSKIALPTEPVCVKRVIYPDENPFLLDHQIGPNQVLPATCAASWIIDTCEKLFPSYHFFELLNYQVLKGLVFSDNTPQEYEVWINVMPSGSDEAIQCQVTIVSEVNGKTTTHYRANVALQQTIPDSPTDKSFLAKADLTPIKDGQYFYDEKILFHGPAFQGFKSVLRVTEDELTTVCHLPHVPAEIQGQFPADGTNPYANDVVLQGVLAWSFHNYEKVCLPAGIERFVQYRPLPFDQDIYVDVKIVSQTKTRAKANAVIFDQQGRIYVETEGIEGTMSKALRALFKESATSLDAVPAESGTKK
ncbi:MAG: SDR family NAD(P)-dependent oxidoreductase [Anaerolineae bacterium]|jgi:NAD(P)-dependent dehydrogenase (short-subunit alcohol dehydrogenase family)|nr:SDR family NAD(P)-dependent oxidoreductase [Anaerolineae bacterium]